MTGTTPPAGKDVVRRLWDCIDRRDFAGVDDLVSPEFVNEVTGDRGVEPWKSIFRALTTAIPDVIGSIDELVEDHGTVVALVTLVGTHTGADWFGRPPEGRPIRWETVHFYRVAGGKITHHRAVRDDLGLLVQLGADPFGRG